MLKKGFMIFALFLLGSGLIFWLGLTLISNNNIESLSSIQKTIQTNTLLLTILRILLLFLLYQKWDSVCIWFAKIKNIDDEVLDDLIQSRNKMMLWFIAVEILIIQNIVGMLFGYIL